MVDKNEHLRSLEEICDGKAFVTEFANMTYCKLALNSIKQIDCQYLSKEKDHNGLRICTYKFINNLDEHYIDSSEDIN